MHNIKKKWTQVAQWVR